MTVQEMHINVDLSFQSINSNVYNDFVPEEVDIYLNNAVDDIIRQTISAYFDNNLDFDQIQTLIVIQDEGLISSGSNNFRDNEHWAPLPSDFNYFISAFVKYGNETTRQTVKVNAVQYESFASYDYNEQLFDELPALVRNNKLYVLQDSDEDYEEIESVILTYCKIPQKINLINNTNTDMPNNSHQEIVDRAVMLMKADLGILNDRERATA